jgi:hypothetical protein
MLWSNTFKCVTWLSPDGWSGPDGVAKNGRRLLTIGERDMAYISLIAPMLRGQHCPFVYLNDEGRCAHSGLCKACGSEEVEGGCGKKKERCGLIGNTR